MARMTGGGALVEMLRRHGVDTLFALPGVQNDALFVALYDAGEALPEPEPALPAPPPDGELIAQAAKLLSTAKQPLIYVGSGAMEAGAEVLALAERLQAPVTTYTGGKGILSDRHYLAQNLLAG